jgi:hypothetical protein
MSLSDLASLGSFASGLAVTVTLIFLVIQTRQANRNQRALMQQGRAASQVDLLLRYSESYFGRVSLRPVRQISRSATMRSPHRSFCASPTGEVLKMAFCSIAPGRSIWRASRAIRPSCATCSPTLPSVPPGGSPGRDSRAASATMSTQSCARRNPRTRLRSRMRGENSSRRNWQRSGREGLQIRRRLIQFAVCRRPLPGMIDWCAKPQLS